MLGRVSQYLAQLADRGIEPGIKINKSVGGPQALPKLISRHDFASAFQEENQKSEKLLRQPRGVTVIPKLSRSQVELEFSETERLGNRSDRGHMGMLQEEVYLSVRFSRTLSRK
jgi:hypothetical protein